jgi:hypothetical protein
MLEREDGRRRQMNSMTMLYNTNLSLWQCSAETIAFLAPVWCCALEALRTTFGGMTRGGWDIFVRFFARVCVTILFLRRHRVAVLEFAGLHASLVVCFCAFGAILVDALLGEVVWAATGEDEDTPTVAVDKDVVRRNAMRLGALNSKRTRLIWPGGAS